ncbi:PREDICTED: coiled-coil domain-containing protein 148-like [Amphimedon queenslandica]|uniref:Coiled-coil domain-containing protein 148 n=1 Tax=Amphimedon queenslandica TaxID=400682 RepID=A0A1X7V023_AMPQE|nr:PREDICTED: coiled-coil domain-containing protein 148-like [Amphimedon queenslandica]|eukprot:XP_011403515.2 PREDICTED: coiled-coil domain-containing protein 148-like [Amphimedon queenslandica]
MSGRDWRKMVAKHREKALPMDLSQEKNKDSLVHSFVCGSRHPKKYSEVNYDELLSIIRDKKGESKEQSARVRRLARRGSDRKAALVLEKHRQAWIKSWKKLKENADSLSNELDEWLTIRILNHSQLLNEYNVILKDFTELQKSWSQFKDNITTDITNIRARLYNAKRCKSSEKPQVKEEMRTEINRVKELHKETWLLLEAEWILINDELRPIRSEIMTYAEGEAVLNRGVAEEVWFLECPDERLRQVMSEEFKSLDEHYQAQANKLDSQLKEKLLNESWSSEDEIHFDHVFDQYPPNERGLRIDRMMKEMTHKTRQEIVSYEMQYCALKYYKKQLGLLTSWWKEKRKELIVKTKQIYAQAIEDQRERKHFEEEKISHQQLCMKLAEKVSKWRRDILARQEEEAAVTARRMYELRAAMEEEEKREKEKRKVIKEQLSQFHSEQEGAKQERIEQEKERSLALREQIKKQLLIDRERAMYRSHLYDVKLQEQAALREELEKEDQRKEKRLEKLRRQVRVEAASDTDRLISETEASKARSFKTEDTMSHITKPLFPLYSFTSDKIVEDKRFKVSEALRDIGLLSTEYAREIIAKIPPPLPPRPDQESTLFK